MAMDSGTFSPVPLIYKGIQIPLPWVREESHHWRQRLRVQPLARSSAKSPSLLLRQCLAELWDRRNFFVSLCFLTSHSSRPSFQKKQTKTFTAFWFRAMEELCMFQFPISLSFALIRRNINPVLVRFGQHTPKMPLLFPLLLTRNLVLLQNGGKQKHGTKALFHSWKSSIYFLWKEYIFAPISILTSNDFFLESKIAEGTFQSGFADVLQFV